MESKYRNLKYYAADRRDEYRRSAERCSDPYMVAVGIVMGVWLAVFTLKIILV